MRKNYLSLLTLGVAAICGLTANAYNFTYTSNDVTTYYNLVDEDSDGTYDYAQITNDGTTSYNCYSGDYRISSRVTYDGTTYPIKSIDASAFRACTELTSITMTGQITEIGAYAFYGCTALTELDLDWGSIETIGNYAFYGCTSIESVAFGSTITTIGDRAFRGCTSLKSVELPESVTSLGTHTFYSCTALESASLPAKITTVPSYTFQSCSSLVSIELPETITEIGTYAFKSCVSLTSFVIPTTVTTVGLQAFYGCTGLTELTFPYGVTAITNSVCRNCSALTTVRLPETVTSVGTYVFNGCTSITAVYSYATSPAASSSSSDTWFSSDVYSSATLYVPEGTSDTYKETNYWSSFTTVTELDYDGSANGLFFNITDETNLYAEVTHDGSGNYNTYCGDLTVPSTVDIDGSTYTVTGVGSSAFRACTNYLGVSLPSTIETIGTAAFYASTSMEEITLPSSVTSIGTNAFRGCTALTSVTLNEGLTSIDISAFSGCTSLTDITLPSTLTTIGNYAFGAATGTQAYAATDAPALTSLVIPNSVTSLGTYICRNNTALESITLPENESLTTIGNYLCCGCTALQSVEIPATFTSTGTYTFSGCTSLTDVTFNEGLKTISTRAFYNCSSLTEITLPESLTTVASYAFNGCTGLTKITAQSLTAPNVQATTAFSSYDVPIYVPLTSADDYAELGFTDVNEYAYLTGDFNDWTVKDESYLMLANDNGDWYTVVPASDIAGKTIDIMLNSTNYLCYGGTAEEGTAYTLSAATESSPTTVTDDLTGSYAAVNIIKNYSESTATSSARVKSSSDTYSLLIGTTDDSSTTGISDLATDGRTVVSEKFYNVAGAEVAEPTSSVKSIYVVVKTYDDGTVAVAKEVR